MTSQISGTDSGAAATRAPGCRRRRRRLFRIFAPRFGVIMWGVMSFSLVFTPDNIPPFPPKQAQWSKLGNVASVKNEPNANVYSAARTSATAWHGSRSNVPDGAESVPGSRQEGEGIRHTLSLGTAAEFGSHLSERAGAGNALAAAATAKAAFLKRTPCAMQMSVITCSP